MEIIRKYRSANIEVVSNGFVVTIGCQTVVAETPATLLSLITDYLKDPVAAEKKLLDNLICYDKMQEPVATLESATNAIGRFRRDKY